MKILLTLLCALAGLSCVAQGHSTLNEELQLLSTPLVEPPKTDGERLIAKTIEFVARERDPNLPKTERLVLHRTDVVTERVVTKGLANRFVLLEQSQIDDLVFRYGEFEYIDLYASFQDADHGVITFAVDLAVRRGSLSMCCGGTIFMYERRNGQWVVTEMTPFEI